MLRNALLECRNLNRLLGCWLWLAVVLLGLAAWLQESSAFRFSGVHLFWGAVRNGWMLALASLPLAWLLTRRADRTEWLQTRARSRWHLVLPPVLGMAIYGTALVGGTALLWFTLDRISVLPASASHVSVLAVQAWVSALPLAAIAPGLASISWGHATRVLVFSLCLLGSLLLTAPLSFPSGADHGGPSWLAPVLATAAGILLSVHLALRSTSH